MNLKRALSAVLLCLVVALFLGAFAEEAHAQADPNLANQSGLGSLFSRDAYDETQGPSKTQLAITAAATVIAIAVVKFV
jgi:hypothetical protein